MLVEVTHLVVVAFTVDVVVLETVLLKVTVLEGVSVVLTVDQLVTVSAGSVMVDVFLAVLVVVTLTVPVASVVVTVL